MSIKSAIFLRQPKTLKLGDSVLVYQFYNLTKEQIVKLTPKGNFYTKFNQSRDALFKIEPAQGKSGFSVTNQLGQYAFDDTPENLEIIEKHIANTLAQQEQQREAEKARQLKIKNTRQSEIEELKTKFLQQNLTFNICMPTADSKLFTTFVPTTRKQFIYATVKVQQCQPETWQNQDLKFKAVASWVSDTGSFTCNSQEFFADEQDALWECLRQAANYC